MNNEPILVNILNTAAAVGFVSASNLKAMYKTPPINNTQKI